MWENILFLSEEPRYEFLTSFVTETHAIDLRLSEKIHQNKSGLRASVATIADNRVESLGAVQSSYNVLHL